METAVATTESATPVTTSSESTSAAPATQETSAPVKTSERPKSFAEALERTATVPEKPAAAPPDAATTVQADAKPQDSVNPKAENKGPIPFDVHHKALENARVKEREAIERDIGWARQVPREAIQEWSGIANRMASDPIGFLQSFTEELHAHPTYGPQLRSHAARTLASGRGQSQVDMSPDLVVDDGQGKQIATFSADRVKAIVDHAVQRAIAKEVQPLKSESEQRAAQAKAAEYTRVANERADSTMSDIVDILEVSDPKADASQKLFAAVADLMDQDASMTPEKAARQVWKTHVRPSIETQGEIKALDKLKQKAAGNTAAPTGAGTSQKRPTNAKELAAYMRAREAGATR